MRYVMWVLRLIIFLIFLGFALQNTELVILKGFLGYSWQAPLIFIVLACFIVGVICGVLASLSSTVALRRKLIAVRKKLKEKTPESHASLMTETRIEPPRDAL